MIQTLEEKCIRSASADEVKECIDKEYSFAASAADEKYGRGRGAKEVLASGANYAELPGFAGKTARELIEALPKGARVLDVGCGYGQLAAEITEHVNQGVEVYGFDAQVQEGQERLARVSIGSVDNLRPGIFDGKQFDLVVSSALLYHLPDYWGAILRMARMLRPGGILLASTMPRIVRDEATGDSIYFRDRNVFNVTGGLVAPQDLVVELNERNPHFMLEYSTIQNLSTNAVNNVGGQLSGKRLSRQGSLDLPGLFYCLSNGNLGYILARASEEGEHLRRAGFVTVQERYQKHLPKV